MEYFDENPLGGCQAMMNGCLVGGVMFVLIGIVVFIVLHVI